ncbi:MAG: hypothetical protein ACI30R_00225 [Sodaliphilus sp.]
MPQLVKGGNIPQNNQNIDQQEAVNVEQTVQADNPQQAANPQAPQQIATPQIVNNLVPLVVFVGPPASGKSMILVRLAQYLLNQGYTIKPDTTFLNTDKYQNGCTQFADKLSTNVALDGTVEFLLVDVIDQSGSVVAKLLEAPGEDFYSTAKPDKNKTVEPYLQKIMGSNNIKNYVVLLDLDSEISFRNDPHHRNSYAQRFLTRFAPKIDTERDRITLLYNKIDTTPFGDINGCTNKSGAEKDAKLYYPSLFNKLQRRAIAGFFTIPNYTFSTFCTGQFSKQVDEYGEEYQPYTPASDIYPQQLWKEITKRWK